MAEIKNNFIKAKMNKDLDDRLVPSGEYRNAQNISISRSEGSDVGALENILGNSKVNISDFGINNLDVIGFLADSATDSIYLFLTDYTDTSPSGLSNFAPSSANCIISRYNNVTNTYIPLVRGSFLNFSKNSPITGVNILEDLLFFTDNRNQPRKINVGLANINSSLNPTYYVTEDTISVAKPAPFEAIRLIDISSGLSNLESTMVNPAQEFMPDGSENPKYNPNWDGDPNYLKDKFVRFSYRYKFDDGEYSIIAPFTQTCFIPKQQGYFLEGDQEEAYRSTIVRFFENNVTNIGLNIPFQTTNPKTDLHISELEILYKESDSTNIKVIESIPVNAVVSNMQSNVNKTVYTFDYISTKPYKTLPADQTTRVYDMVPVRALAQEVSGNRVMYGNFMDRMSPPRSLDYGVGYSNKLYIQDNEKYQSQVEYPNHTLKQNRNYQVGVVLSDKFGRQSSVILSSNDFTGSEEEEVQYGGSTIYLPYFNGELSEILSWPGYALRVLFNSAIPPSDSTIEGYPGLYSPTNPLGWYSYKIVVRQQEQDYYNVFLPGILNGYPSGSTNFDTEVDQTANIVLINDNINKVPRDLSEVGPDQRQYRSSVQIFGRVTPDPLDSTLNKQYKPGILSDTVVSISTVNDTNYNESQGTNLTYPEFYQSETNPLIGRVSTQQSIGTIGSATYNITLGVYETSPAISLLDIYWETSTTGLISELNNEIDQGFNGPVYINLNGIYNHNEGMAPGTKVVSGAYAETSARVPINDREVSFELVSAVNGGGYDITTSFNLEKTPNSNYQFDLFINKSLYYGSTNQNDIRNFTFTVACTDHLDQTTTNLEFTGSLSNVAPSITNCPTSPINTGELTSPWEVFNMEGVNGSYGIPLIGLKWGLENIKKSGTLISEQNMFVIDPTSGLITNPNGTAEEGATYEFTVTLEDAAGEPAEPCTIYANIGSALPDATIVPYASLESTQATYWDVLWVAFGSESEVGMRLYSGQNRKGRALPPPPDGTLSVLINKENGLPVSEETIIQFYYRTEESNLWQPIGLTKIKKGKPGQAEFNFTNVQDYYEYRVAIAEG
jgi:hypothetical protein